MPVRATRIGELARRTGVSPGCSGPGSSGTGSSSRHERRGFRLYSAADEARVQRMQGLVSGGLAAAQAARLVLSGEPEPRTDSGSVTTLEEAAGNLSAALDRLDEQAANSALDRLLSAYTVETVLQEVVLPYLHRLGERWEAGEVGRPGALRLPSSEDDSSAWPRTGAGQGHFAILACVPGEHHELGLLVFGVALRRRGWRITYLGTDSPIGAVADIALPRTSGRGPH